MENSNIDFDGELKDPSFIVLGAYKAGTTALYRYMSQHPQIYMTPFKEANFFAMDGAKIDFTGPRDKECSSYRRSVVELDDYRQLFADRTYELSTGDISPLYLYSSSAAHKIKNYLPNVKLIVILRQPAERAISSYVHLVRDNREVFNDFRHSWENEQAKIKQGWDPIHCLQSVGFYYEQLCRYYDLFPKDNIKVILYDAFQARPYEVFREIFEFIGVDKTFKPDISIRYGQGRLPIDRPIANWIRESLGKPLKKSNKVILSSIGSSIIYWLTYKPIFDDQLREELTDFYRDDILKLQHLIDNDLSSWLN